MDLSKICARSARYWPHAIAAKDERFQVSFAQLEARSNRLTHALLALGVQPGDRVAVQGWNRVEIFELELACYKGGFIKVPLNARLSPDETIHTLQDADACVLVAGQEHAAVVSSRRSELPNLRTLIGFDDAHDALYADVLANAAETPIAADNAPDAVAVLHYTSGSSGVLKAAMQTFGNRKATLLKFLASPMRRAQPGDVQAHVGPITHASGMSLMYLLYCGATSLMIDKFSELKLLQAIQDERVSRLFMVPTMINRMVNHPKLKDHDLSSLNLVLYGAAPMAPALVEQAITAFGPILVQGYGAGETGSMVTMLTEQDHVDALAHNPKRLSSCGRCYADTDVRIVTPEGKDIAPGEVGEITVRGPDVMAGYWRAPELTAQALVDGYYLTGDLATVDEEGYIYIVDRKKEMIITGGFNVYPNEVEAVLYTHPAVFEAAVVGVPDAEWGEAIKAVVVLKSGHVVEGDELLAHCSSRLAGFKRPRSVDFTNELPKNPNGKVVRRLVREPYWADQARMV